MPNPPIPNTPTDGDTALSICFDGETPLVRGDLTGGPETPGWLIELAGCGPISHEELADLWAKVRKHILRPRGVDVVALFYYHRNSDAPQKMYLIPDFAICERKQIANQEYVQAVLPILRYGVWAFAEFLAFAQELYLERQLCPEEFSDTPALADILFRKENAEAILAEANLPEWCEKPTKQFLRRLARQEAREDHRKRAKAQKAAIEPAT